MNDHPTRRAALLAAGLAALVALVAWAVATTRQPPGPAPPTANPSRAPSPPPRPPADAGIDEHATFGAASRKIAVALDGLAPAGFIARERPRALAVARRFIDGYFAFEARERSRWGAAEVQATATPHLAATLLAATAALPPAMSELPPRAEVYAIDLEFDKPPTTALIRAEVKRGSDRSDIAVIAKRTETRWTITDITE